MTRHRDRLDVHWSGEAIGTRRLERLVSPAALKDTSLDYDSPVASPDAAGDIRARIKRSAGTFTDLEATLTGRLENARSLAGIAA